MAPSLNLEDDQRFALMKFRRNIQDVIQPDYDDHFLLRWLRARKWDVAAAEKMLRDSLEWRKTWKVDELEQWEAPEMLEKYMPHGLCGYDKNFGPVVICPFAGFDVYGILHMVSRKDTIKITIRFLERYLNICRAQEKKHGHAAGQITIIFDMDGFNLRQYMWRPAGEIVISLIQMYEANYPEILKICYIINAPKVFAFGFSIAKKFMNEYTISKIQIFKNDPPRWKAALLSAIPNDQLPAYFGGSLTDPDGNPKLTSKVCQGGKVPKSLYLKKSDKEKIQGDLISAVVRKGDKLKLDFHPTKTGSLLSWEFRTEDHDIKFGILRRSENGEESEVVPIHRVSAHQLDEIGILTCDLSSSYSVIFDNSYSFLRNKKIQYSVKLSLPTETAEDELSLVKS